MTAMLRSPRARRTVALAVLALAASVALVSSACGGDGAPGDGDAGVATGSLACQESDRAWAHEATLAILGRRPLSSEGALAIATAVGERRRPSPFPQDDPRAQVARALMRDPAYLDRWAEVLMDHLRVQRVDDQMNATCYGARARSDDQGELAAHVRDHDARVDETGDGLGPFTMLDLVRSSLALDDLTPVLRANLFAMIARPIPAANVPLVQAELARRQDFGNMFDAAYLHRDIVCLGCHNSEGSVTFDEDPSRNRHFAMPGLFEKALYGSSTGIDLDRAHAVFRYDGFVRDPFGGDGAGVTPWGWSESCGEFFPEFLAEDPAGIDARFGSITGSTATVYDLEQMLARGVDALATRGLELGDGGEIADPDQALAWLVGASLAEAVWKEIVGTPLTVANYFPRNAASRDLLWQLTRRFVASRFSLRGLIADVVTSAYFGLAAPAAACAPYGLPNVFNPWVTGEADPAMRTNGPADGVFALPARTLLSAQRAALGWPAPRFELFPDLTPDVDFCLYSGASCDELDGYCLSLGACCLAAQICRDPDLAGEIAAEQTFQRGIGVPLKNAERGFAGLDFQARLTWEERFGSCENPVANPDFVADLATRAVATGATPRDAVLALNDRLTGEPLIAEGDEAAALEALLDASLDTPAQDAAALDAGLRRVCGALLLSPQFLLAGLP